MTDASAPPVHERPSWAPLTLVAFVALVICTNVAAATWAAGWYEAHPATLLMLSSRNRWLAYTLGLDIALPAYFVVGFLRIAVAFVVCHLIGRAYSHTALGWFTRYLGATQDAIDQFNRGFAKAEWILIPFFAGSNLVAAISGVHRTPWARLLALLSIGIIARLLLFWWLSIVFADELQATTEWIQKYSWWAIGISVALVVVANVRNFRRGASS